MLKIFIRVLLLSLIANVAIAGKNPIGWQLNRNFDAVTHVGRTYTIIYTFTNNLPVTLVNAISIQKSASPASEFSYTDNCSGTKLASGGTCSVSVNFTPLIIGNKDVQLFIRGYDDNIVPLPIETTTTIGTDTQGDVTGQPSLSLKSSMDLGSSQPYQFTFTNRGGTNATNVVSTITQSNGVSPTITANTCMDDGAPGTLNASNSCYISGSLAGNQLGEITVSAVLTFDDALGSPASTSTNTTVVSPGSGAVAASWVVPNYLPPVMAEGSTNTLKALFTNIGDSVVTFTGIGVGSYTCVDEDSNNCSGLLSSFSSTCNDSLAVTNPPSTCELDVTFTAPSGLASNKTYTVTASLPYTSPAGSPTTISTTGSVLTTVPTTRKILLQNNCGFDVWFSLNGASVSGYSCDSSGSGCPTGTSCNTSTSECYWNNFAPDSGTYEMANGTTRTVTIPARNYGGVQWSGNISASLLCSGSSCGVAACGNNGGQDSCAAGTGFSQPATQAEVTMNVSEADSYDVEVINGFHIPISMAPVYYFTGDVPTYATADNYSCGVPGSATAANGFGACDWNTAIVPAPSNGNLQSSGYYRVTQGSKTCDITSGTAQCGGTGEVCGLYQDLSTQMVQGYCGNFLGYWTADQVCSLPGLSSSISSFFSCNQSLPTQATASAPPYFPANATLFNLMKCQVPTGDLNPLYNSCYLTYSGYSLSEIKTCCGCVDWWNSAKTSGVDINANENTQSCGEQIDPVWTQYVQPQVQWLKKACPSAYAYPFDDKTSGFNCSNNLSGETNSLGYVITFCPGNNGKPTGINEGRG